MLEACLLFARVAIGTFFAISGFHKLFHPARHKSLVATLESLKIPFVSFNEWFVPAVEFSAGMALVVGLFYPFPSLGLIAICVVACGTDGPNRIREWQPINRADIIADILYLQETWYLIILGLLLSNGIDRFSIDHAIGLNLIGEIWTFSH